MAEFAVNENNKENPKSEPLQLVSVNKGFQSGVPDYEIFYLIITASNHQGESKYETQVNIGYFNGKFILIPFTPA
ncbi:hypothetical protein LINPERPRIM_LOCUS17849 [Linum perenne]